MPDSRILIAAALLLVASPVIGQLLMVAEPGTVIEKGQAVARIDKSTLRLQRAEQEVLLERAEINLRQLNSQLRRQRELENENLVSEFELEQTEANRDLAVSDANLTKVRIRQIDDQIRRADVLAPFTGDVRSQTFEARIDLPLGATGNWTVGQLVSIAIPIRAKQLTLTIPRDALVLRRNGAFVFRISGENKAERIQVEIGDSAGDLVSVSGPLAEGDRVTNSDRRSD